MRRKNAEKDAESDTKVRTRRQAAFSPMPVPQRSRDRLGWSVLCTISTIEKHAVSGVIQSNPTDPKIIFKIQIKVLVGE